MADEVLLELLRETWEALAALTQEEVHKRMVKANRAVHEVLLAGRGEVVTLSSADKRHLTQSLVFGMIYEEMQPGSTIGSTFKSAEMLVTACRLALAPGMDWPAPDPR